MKAPERTDTGMPAGTGNSPTGPGVNPANVMRLATAYWESQALLTANRVGLFAALADGPLAAAELAARLGLQPRPARLLFNACAGLGLLTVRDDVFANSSEAAAFLVPGKPGYLGNAIRYSDNLYASWGNLESTLRSGVPALAAEAYLGDDARLTRDFVFGMHERALGIGRALVGTVDLGGRRRLLDVGGGPGTYASLFAARDPLLRATVLDLPGIVAHARDIVAMLGAGDRVSTLAGDFHLTAFPAGHDVVLISGVLHRETEAGCRHLFTKAHGCLDAGGLLVVSDVFTDADGCTPAFATLFGLNMLLTAPDGGVHADADVAAWMQATGFVVETVRALPPPLPHRVVIGRKA